MSFTYNLATDTGKVRLYIADTDETSYVFEDEEIAVFLSGRSVNSAAAFALETLARDRVKRARRREFGDEKEEQRAIAEWLALAAQLRAEETISSAPVISPIQKRWPEDPYQTPKHWDTTGTMAKNSTEETA